MKKHIVLGLSICLILFSFLSCEKKAPTPKAGTADPSDMLNLLPADSQGVLFADIHKAMSIEAVSSSIKEQENSKKYFEFIEKTGLDPEKDIYYLAVSISAKSPDSLQKMAAVINLKYNKDSLLEFIKTKTEEEEQEIIEVDYNGVTIYTMEQDDEKSGFSFLDESNIVAGNLDGIQSVLDVVAGQGDNISKNKELSALLKETNKDTLFWGAFLVPQEAVEEASVQNPMLQSLKSVNAVTMNFDYQNKSMLIDIDLKSSDPEKNEQLATALNGIKGIASMSAQEKPEIGELMNKIQVISGDEGVKVSADIPEELIKKITESTKAEKTKETEK
jgi:hypothetical protein